MGVARQVIARVLVALALLAGSAALGAWWTSLLAGQAAGSLSTAVRSSAAAEIEQQINRLDPGAGQAANARQAVSTALSDPQLTQMLAAGGTGGGQALSTELAKLDPGLAGVLGGQGLNVDVGEHTLARYARTLHHDAGYLAVAALALAVAAVALAALRHRIVRRLALTAAIEGGLAVAGSWLVPTLVGHLTHGTVRRVALQIVHGGDPVRGVLVEVLVGAAAVYGASVAAELFGGRRVTGRRAPVTPLAPGRVA